MAKNPGPKARLLGLPPGLTTYQLCIQAPQAAWPRKPLCPCGPKIPIIHPEILLPPPEKQFQHGRGGGLEAPAKPSTKVLLQILRKCNCHWQHTFYKYRAVPKEVTA